jgi:glutamate racemase
LPHETLLSGGDSLHFPYGPKPVEEIRRYAMDIAAHLVELGVKMLVVACNSIEVSAIGDIAASHGVPVVGVINPGARAAIRATRNGLIGVIGTQATIATGAYQRAVGAEAEILGAACPVFVEHVERGDTTSDELRAAARGYLAPLKERGIDTLILGCTHYPLLSGLLQLELGPGVILVSSAEETAKDVYATLLREGLARGGDAGQPAHEFLCTGDPALFQNLAERFLGPEIGDLHVRRIELEGAG